MKVRFNFKFNRDSLAVLNCQWSLTPCLTWPEPTSTNNFYPEAVNVPHSESWLQQATAVSMIYRSVSGSLADSQPLRPIERK